MLTDSGESKSYREVQDSEQKHDCYKTTEEEIDSLKKNHTYNLVKLPNGKRTLKSKWVFRLKKEDNSAKPRYKARLVVKSFFKKKKS